MNKIRARAPGKLILAGEHSVAQGAPALVLAVDYYVTATMAPIPHAHQFEFEFCNFNKKINYTYAQLLDLKEIIDSRYQQFKNKQLPISAVLSQPTDLACYTLAQLLKSSEITNTGLKIILDSNIPIGCGLGSSAATIVSLFTAFKQKHDLQTLKAIESLQHGVSSGIDLTVSALGGCHYFQNLQTTPRVFPKVPLYLVNTGARNSGSGAAISHVAAAWEHNKLLPAFTKVVNKIDGALNQQDFAGFCAGIKENHALLCELGIVPAKIIAFISALEEQGFAAKISGAGAVKGDQAGMVIICGESDPTLICQAFGYEVSRIQGEVAGACIV